jgi:hypothetical protein
MDESVLRARSSNDRSHRSPRHAVARALTHQASPASIQAPGILTPERWPRAATARCRVKGSWARLFGAPRVFDRVAGAIGRFRGFQAPVVAIWYRWSFNRLWVAASNRHSERTAERPRRRKRWNPRLCLSCPYSGFNHTRLRRPVESGPSSPAHTPADHAHPAGTPHRSRSDPSPRPRRGSSTPSDPWPPNPATTAASTTPAPGHTR